MEGKTFGSYKVLERLGAGGQGHVYRALDTTLDREIAIKVLPAAFVADPVRLKQFRQEAKLLAAASHPNIAAVYGIEQFEDIRFFTQELVPGRTLAARIEDGPLDLQDTLEIARQIASALEAAHDKNLIHRDLKPANVMVKPDGGVKVLDFGLALPVDRDEEDGDGVYALSDSTPTMSRSAESVVVGTAPYMSPDQARGRQVDRRADIWAFGCVLFECLTGKRPFVGDTLLDTFSAIVRAEPDWSLLPPATPMRLRHLLRRCLRKRASDRLQHIGDARIVIEEILDEPMDETEVHAERFAASAVSRTAWGVGAMAAIAGALVGALLWSWQQGAPPARAPLRAVITLDPARLGVDESSAIELSPDGSGVLYAARTAAGAQLYHRAWAAFEAVPIDGTVGAEDPFYSPDGGWIGFFSSDFQLAKIPAGGGVPIPICEVPVGNTGAAWLVDDTIVYGTAYTGSGLMRVGASGGTPVEVTSLEPDVGETNHAWPHALPDGRTVLFTVTTPTGTSIAAVDLTTGERRTVLEGGADARYVESGYLLFTQQGTLFATRFDLDRLAPIGAPRAVVEQLFTHSRGARTSYAVGRDGTLVYAPGSTAPREDRFVWVDRQGTAAALAVEPGDYNHPRLSPDGAYLAYDSTADGRGHVWVLDLERETSTRLTTQGDNRMPVWSPNGQNILFASTGRGAAGLYWHRADGVGETREMLVSDHPLWPRSWHAEGIAYYELNPVTGRDIWTLGTDDDGPRPFQRSRFNERSPMFSPDGRWLAYVSNESGRDEIYVQAFGGSDRRYTISNGGGREPVWSSDGRELFYRADDWLFAVPITSVEPFRAGAPEALFQGTYKTAVLGSNQLYDVDASGQRFLMIEIGDVSRNPDRLNVVLDFTHELDANANGSD